MANLTKEDVQKLIEVSYPYGRYMGQGNTFIIPLAIGKDDQRTNCVILISLEEQEGGNQRLEISSHAKENISAEQWKDACDFCNQYQANYNYIYTYVQRWRDAEGGQFIIGASVENPGDLPQEWLLENFMKPCLQIIQKFWLEVWLKFGGMIDYMKSAAPKKGIATNDGTPMVSGGEVDTATGGVGKVKQSSNNFKGLIWVAVFFIVALVLLRIILKA